MMSMLLLTKKSAMTFEITLSITFLLVVQNCFLVQFRITHTIVSFSNYSFFPGSENFYLCLKTVQFALQSMKPVLCGVVGRYHKILAVFNRNIPETFSNLSVPDAFFSHYIAW